LQNEERSERLEINEEDGKRTQNQAREPGEQKIYIDFFLQGHHPEQGVSLFITCIRILTCWPPMAAFTVRVFFGLAQHRIPKI
jgi:hypothetical protein